MAPRTSAAIANEVLVQPVKQDVSLEHYLRTADHYLLQVRLPGLSAGRAEGRVLLSGPSLLTLERGTGEGVPGGGQRGDALQSRVRGQQVRREQRGPSNRLASA